MHPGSPQRVLQGVGVLTALLLGSWGAWARSGGAAGTELPPPASSPAGPEPFYTSAIGYFATGIAFADLNGDGLEDMIVSNGNDMSPQPLTVFYNRGTEAGPVFGKYPDWYSDEIQYMGGLAVGDVDGDGRADVAVAVGMDHSRRTGTGFVEVFFNRGGRLETRASYRTDGGFLTAGCALGDVDGDGRLDLVVPVLAEGVAPFPPKPGEVQPGRARIYLNRGGVLDRSPDWTSAEGVAAGDAVVADVNQDGWMDVAFAGLHTEVYYGRPAPSGNTAGGVPLPVRPGWTSEDPHPFSYSLDAGSPGRLDTARSTPAPGHQGLLLAVSSSCLGSPCESRFLLYRPDQGRRPVWQSPLAERASKLLLADLRGSGYLDLVADQWGPADYSGAALWLFLGKEGGYGARPDVATRLPRIGEGLAVADLSHAAVRSVRHRFEARERLAVLTLPERRVLAVEAVEIAGRKLASAEYAWAPGANWISLARPLEPGGAAEVTYRTSPALDVAEAVWQPQFGSTIYRHLAPQAPDSRP